MISLWVRTITFFSGKICFPRIRDLFTFIIHLCHILNLFLVKNQNHYQKTKSIVLLVGKRWFDWPSSFIQFFNQFSKLSGKSYAHLRICAFSHSRIRGFTCSPFRFRISFKDTVRYLHSLHSLSGSEEPDREFVSRNLFLSFWLLISELGNPIQNPKSWTVSLFPFFRFVILNNTIGKGLMHPSPLFSCSLVPIVLIQEHSTLKNHDWLDRSLVYFGSALHCKTPISNWACV